MICLVGFSRARSFAMNRPCLEVTARRKAKRISSRVRRVAVARVGGKRLRTWRVSPLTSRPGLITPTGRCQLGRAGQVFFWGFGPGSGDPFPCQALGPVKVQHPMNPLASCKMGDARAVWGWCVWSCETWPKVLGSTSAFTGAMTVFRGTPRGLQVCLPKVAGVQT